MTYDPDNVFAKIIRGQAPAHRVYEDAWTLAFMDLMPQTDGHTLVMVALNSLPMLVLYGVLGGYLLGVGRLPVPWQGAGRHAEPGVSRRIAGAWPLPLYSGFVCKPKGRLTWDTFCVLWAGLFCISSCILSGPTSTG